jgi:hypothetical protein
MGQLSVLADTDARVDGIWHEGRPGISADDLDAAIGWTLKAEGLCRGDVCVPVADRAALDHPAGVDILGVAAALDRPAAADESLGAVAIGAPAATRRAALRDRQAPDFTLADIDGVLHSLSGYTGKKRLLVAFSSW